MKNLTKLLATLSISLSIFSCSSNVDSLNSVDLQNQGVEALATASIKLSMEKSVPSTSKKVVTPSKLKDKAKDSPNAKVLIPNVSIKNLPAKNGVEEQAVADMITPVLFAMNKSKNYEEGVKIAFQTLETLSNQNVYIAKLTYTASKAALNWDEAYRIIALGFANLIDQKVNNQQNASQLAMAMMSTTNSHQCGAKVGYAILELIASTDNVNTRNLVMSVYAKAQSYSSWQDAYNVIRNGFDTLSKGQP